MADTYSDPTGLNTRKVQASSKFGTRELKFLQITLDAYDLYNDVSDFDDFIDRPSAYKNPDSLYSKIIRTLSETAEFYEIGGPSAMVLKSFVFGIAAETGQWQYSDEGNVDYNEAGVDETDGGEDGRGYHNRYFSSGGSGINDLVDRLYNLFFLSDQNNNSGPDVFSIDDFNLYELEDTGGGLLPGRQLY
jgi:hypothetical protein